MSGSKLLFRYFLLCYYVGMSILKKKNIWLEEIEASIDIYKKP